MGTGKREAIQENKKIQIEMACEAAEKLHIALVIVRESIELLKKAYPQFPRDDKENVWNQIYFQNPIEELNILIGFADNVTTKLSEKES